MRGGSEEGVDTHQVIVDEHKQHLVWPLADRLPLGWRAIGKVGPRHELTSYLQLMSVETMPAPLLVTDGRTFDTQWG